MKPASPVAALCDDDQPVAPIPPRESHEQVQTRTAARSTAGGRLVWCSAHCAEYAPGTIIFGQGDSAPSIMYVETGAVRLSVLSHSGKEAVVAVLDPGHLLGEGCLAGQTQRMATATAMAASTVLTVEKPEMVHQLRAQPDFAERFLSQC